MLHFGEFHFIFHQNNLKRFEIHEINDSDCHSTGPIIDLWKEDSLICRSELFLSRTWQYNSNDLVIKNCHWSC